MSPEFTDRKCLDHSCRAGESGDAAAIFALDHLCDIIFKTTNFHPPRSLPSYTKRQLIYMMIWESGTDLGHKRPSWFQDVSCDVQSLRDKQPSADTRPAGGLRQTLPYLQPIGAEPGCTHPHRGARLLWREDRRSNLRTTERRHLKRDRQEVSIPPSGAPSHTTRSAG